MYTSQGQRRFYIPLLTDQTKYAFRSNFFAKGGGVHVVFIG